MLQLGEYDFEFVSSILPLFWNKLEDAGNPIWKNLEISLVIRNSIADEAPGGIPEHRRSDLSSELRILAQIMDVLSGGLISTLPYIT